MFDPPIEEVIRLLPCAICSAPFDPATIPSHVYDPYHTFLLFAHHASICPSCFAEELAKRTRPDPETFGQVGEHSGKQQSYGAFMSGRNSSAATIISPRRMKHIKAASTASILRSASTTSGADPKHRFGEASRSSTFSRHGSQREARSNDMLRSQISMKESSTSSDAIRHHSSPSIGQSSSKSRTLPELPQERKTHQHRPSNSIAQSLSSQKTSPDLAQSQETYRHRPSTSIGQSTKSRKTSPDCPRRSQSLHRAPKIPQRVASRNHSRSQSLTLMQHSFPDLSRLNHERVETRPRPLAVDIIRKSTENVRRKVSFRQGAPIPQSFNPQSPPYQATNRVRTLPEQRAPTPIEAVNEITFIEPVSAPSILPAMLGMHHPHSIVQVSPHSSRLSWSSWRIRRRQEREAREQKWQARKELQKQRKLREEKEKGMGLDLFCPQCQVVVKTTPKWRDGSCCVLYSACLFACTGPFCLCLLLPCAAHQVLDVDGRCPRCMTTLSTWNRRKNQLTLLTWAGVRDSATSDSSPSLAPRARTSQRLDRQASVRLPPAPTPPSIHYSRPRTATIESNYSRPRTATVSSAAPTGVSSISGSRPRTMSSAQQTATASTSRSSGGSPPLTTRSSPSSRMAASAAGTSSSNRTGSSSNRTGTVSHAGTGHTVASGSTGTTLVNTGHAPQTAYPRHGHDDPAVVATDFAEFIDGPVGQEYVLGHHAGTHIDPAGSSALQAIAPQQLPEDIQLDEIGRAVG